jgi:hypothetical protein
MRWKNLNLEMLSSLKNCSCFVWRYRAGHSRLVIKMVSGDVTEGDVFYLVLTSVQYFSGPMVWSGSDFRLGSKEEISQVYSMLPVYHNSFANKPPELHDALLLIFGDSNQILCHDAAIYEADPGE